MAGTIIVDRLESDASYASSINIASPLVIANSSTFTSDITLTKATPYLFITSTGGTNQNIWMKDNANNTFAIESQAAAQGGVFLSNRTASAPIYIRTANTGGTLGFSAVINQYGIGVGDSTPQNGMGIRFPATQSASSDPNTLDDYEEGTWTPNAQNNGSTSNWTNKVGHYRKIGGVVTCWFRCDGGGSSNGGSGSGAVILSGLPFSMAQGNAVYLMGYASVVGGTNSSGWEQINSAGGTSTSAQILHNSAGNQEQGNLTNIGGVFTYIAS